MTRYVRALIWLRWRILMRSLTRGRRRDIVERFSIAAESLAPLVVLLMVVPGALALGVAAFLAGYWIERPSGDVLLQVVQYSILFGSGFALVAPLVLTASTQASGQIRLLLLPIPRGLLYLTQTLGAIADPWIALVVPTLATLPLGLALGGRIGAALTAAAAGLLVLAIIVAVAALSASLLQLLLRNRRRGELALVIAMMVLPVIFMIPSLMIGEEEWRGKKPPRERSFDDRFERALKAGTRYLPSGLYGTAVRDASGLTDERNQRANRHPRDPGVPRPRGGALAAVAGLALIAFALHAAGWRSYRRLLDTPSSSSVGWRRRRERSSAEPPGASGLLRHLPGVSVAAGAVAWAFVRLVFRTPRGKTVVFSVAVMMPILAVMMMRAGGLPFGFATLRPGFSMAIFGLALTLLSLGPMTLNQFAIDGAGLTLEFLTPLSDRELLVGKAVGGALVLVGPAVFVLAISIALSPTAPMSLWVALAFGAASTYALLAPANATLSAMFPRTVNLASIGRDSNAHQGANVLGLLALAAAAAPAALVSAVGLLIFDSARVTAMLVALWCAAAIAIAALFFRLIERLVAARRENLALVAQGR